MYFQTCLLHSYLTFLGTHLPKNLNTENTLKRNVFCGLLRGSQEDMICGEEVLIGDHGFKLTEWGLIPILNSAGRVSHGCVLMWCCSLTHPEFLFLSQQVVVFITLIQSDQHVLQPITHTQREFTQFSIKASRNDWNPTRGQWVFSPLYKSSQFLLWQICKSFTSKSSFISDARKLTLILFRILFTCGLKSLTSIFKINSYKNSIKHYFKQHYSKEW